MTCQQVNARYITKRHCNGVFVFFQELGHSFLIICFTDFFVQIGLSEDEIKIKLGVVSFFIFSSKKLIRRKKNNNKKIGYSAFFLNNDSM